MEDSMNNKPKSLQCSLLFSIFQFVELTGIKNNIRQN